MVYKNDLKAISDQLFSLQNQNGMPLYKEITSEKLSRAQTQCSFFILYEK
jgi:hypothetical protein